jgi:hypothetical protein
MKAKLLSSIISLLKAFTKIDEEPYWGAFLNSVNNMNISPQELRKLRGLYPSKGFICIFQSTKDGSSKGSNEYEYDVDISIKIENRIPESIKNLYK